MLNVMIMASMYDHLEHNHREYTFTHDDVCTNSILLAC